MRRTNNGGSAATAGSRSSALVSMVLLSIVALTGCGLTTVVAAAGLSEGKSSSGLTRDASAQQWRQYLPTAQDFPEGWDVSYIEIMKKNSSKKNSVIENMAMIFGSPPENCSLPRELTQIQNHPSVNGKQSIEKKEADIFSTILSKEVKVITVEIGPQEGNGSVLSELKRLARECSSFTFSQDNKYDSDLSLRGSIRSVESPIHYEDTVGITMTLDSSAQSSYGSSSVSRAASFSFHQDIYAAHIKGLLVVAMSYSLKDSGNEDPLVGALFQKTVERVNGK